MRYIKTYEEMSDRTYWKISTQEPNLEISLKKLKDSLGCDLTKRDFYHLPSLKTGKSEPFFHKKRKHVYITVMTDNDSNFDVWEWTEDDRFTRNANFKYAGEIEVTPEDIDEYNLNKVAGKYNL